MKFWLTLKIAVLVVLGLALSSCSDYHPNSFEFIFKELNDYGVSDEFELSAESLIIGSDFDKTTLFFVSLNEEVAKINEEGKIKCIEHGRAEIVATVKNYNGEIFVTSFMLNVQEKAIILHDFSIKESRLSMICGQLLPVHENVNLIPENYIYPYTVQSLDEDIVSIENNTITAKKQGEARVLFSVMDF